jgi:glucose/arabinose dehydrogenase
MCWDSYSLITNTAAEPIPTEANLQPHLGAGPRAYVSDSQNNRICMLQFSGTMHSPKPKVTEFITGLMDPWDIVEWGDELIISEREANRIVAYSKAGEYVRTRITAPMATCEKVST